MKIICERKKLLDALNIAQKAISSRSTIPVLSGIKITAKDNQVVIYSSDLDMSIKTKIQANVIQEGSVVILAKLFMDIIRKLPEEKIEIFVEEKMIIKAGKSSFEIVVLNGEDFPKMTTNNADEKFIINREIFKDMIKQTAFAASTDESKGVLCGILVELKDENISMVALDGFRMSVRKEKVNNSLNKSFIIPSRILNELYKIISEHPDDNLRFHLSDKMVIIQMSNTIVSIRLLSGNFIEYNTLISNDNTCIVNVDKSNLLDSIERASLISTTTGKNNFVLLNITDNKMVISSKSEEGCVQEELIVSKKGEDLNIGFNSKYILDVLKNIDEQNIKLEFKNNVSPALIKSINSGKYIHLVLPVRIKSV